MDSTARPAQRTRGLPGACEGRWWRQRGKSQLRGFKLLEPGAEIERLMGLLANIHDPDYVTRHIDFTNWFEWTQDLPGAFYLWIIEHLFVHNELARGVLVVDGRQVNLSAIDCPIFLLAGTKDHITPPEQVWALADLVSTPAEHISRELVDAGHLGLFMGRAALAEHWRPIAERVRTYSERAADVRSPMTSLKSLKIPDRVH